MCRQAQPARPQETLGSPDFKDLEPLRQKFSHQRNGSYPQIPPNSAGGGRGMPRGGGDCLNGMPSPTVPLQGVLRGWRAPPALHWVGCPHPKPTPAPPAQRARRGARDAGSGPSPRFRGPGPARCVADVLGPGPRSAHWAPERALRPEKHLLCTEPWKLSPSLLAFMATDWEVPGRPGCQGGGR